MVVVVVFFFHSVSLNSKSEHCDINFTDPLQMGSGTALTTRVYPG